MIDNEIVSKVNDMLLSCLEKEKRTHTNIVEHAKQLLNLSMFNCLTSEMLEAVVDKFESNVSVKVFDSIDLTNGKHTNNWVSKKTSNRNYFERYRRYLRSEGFEEPVIDNIESHCEKILSFCVDPSNHTDINNRKKKGLVVGDVQSGKTANYIGLINLACDYGYKIIVLLAGMTDSLRKQTQMRIDAGLIGAESNSISSDIQYIGVGIDASKYFAIPLTNERWDFVKFVKNSNNTQYTDYNKPIVLVVKKNASILQQVMDWLKPGQNNIDCDNVLIIDDEADNASLNTKKPDKDPSAINSRIRGIYNNFKRASYIGYTATPFANIFINPNDDDNDKDLFPSDFIVQLNASESYFGTQKSFSTNSNHIRLLDENELFFLPVKHAKDEKLDALPDSLKEACLAFLINNVIRTIRGQDFKHRTMMINISRYNTVQENIKFHIEQYINKLSNIINQDSYKNTENFIKNEEMKKIHDLFCSDFYVDIRTKIGWEQIKDGLSNEINKFIVAVINNKYKDDKRFDYNLYKSTGARVIAIGGFVLSRGLTLEGLMVSYFSRNATAYDTMLQMCRWFGYRSNYEDVCRIYLSQINVDNFSAVIEAVDELKEQFQMMSLKGKTPSQFGLMIRESPDTLETAMLITSRNKMYNSSVRERYLSYGGVYPDTSKLFKDPTINSANISVFKKFLFDLKEMGIIFEKIKTRYILKDAPKEKIAELIQNIKVPLENRKFDTDNISQYILSTDDFSKWDVVIANGDSSLPWVATESIIVNRVERSFNYRDSEKIIRISGHNNRIIDPGIFSSGLSEEELTILKKKSDKEQLSAKDYLSIDRKPLLAIYPIDLKISNEDLLQKEIKEKYGENPLLGFAIGFPNKEGKVKIKYRINKVKQAELEQELDIDEDEEDEDED